MYSITLSNGTQLSNLELNGNNFISPEVIEDFVFEGNLNNVVISNGDTHEIFKDMMLVSNRVENGKSWFIICEKTKQEIYFDSLNEQIAQADETAIALYESQELQEEINTQQDEALVEIYEMLG